MTKITIPDDAETIRQLRAQLVEWQYVVSWLDNDEKTYFDWCAGGADPDGEFSRIGLRRVMPDGTELVRAYTATGPWEALQPTAREATP